MTDNEIRNQGTPMRSNPLGLFLINQLRRQQGETCTEWMPSVNRRYRRTEMTETRRGQLARKKIMDRNKKSEDDLRRGALLPTDCGGRPCPPKDAPKVDGVSNDAVDEYGVPIVENRDHPFWQTHEGRCYLEMMDVIMIVLNADMEEDEYSWSDFA